jgi:hypothetical protein
MGFEACSGSMRARIWEAMYGRLNVKLSVVYEDKYKYYEDKYKYYEDTLLYIFCKKNQENATTNEILDKYPKLYSVYCEEWLYKSYEKLIDDGHEDLVYDILDDANTNDGVALYMLAVDKKNANILDYIFSLKFDPNQLCFKDACGGIPDINVLSYATVFGDLDLVKMLVDYGADPTKNSMQSVSLSLFKLIAVGQSDIFDYFMESEISDQNLRIVLESFYNCAFIHKNVSPKCRETIVDKIVGKISDPKVVLEDEDSYMIIGLDAYKKIIERGYEIKDNTIMFNACCVDRYDLVKYLLELEVTPDAKILTYVVGNMKLQMLKLFIENQVDFSQVPSPEPKHMEAINEYEKAGLNRDVMLAYFIRYINHPR